MEAVSNSLNEVEKEIVCKLKYLNCPLLGNLENWWVQELIFSPGEHRNKLLCWVFSRIDFQLERLVTSLSSENNLPNMINYVVSIDKTCKSYSYNAPSQLPETLASIAGAFGLGYSTKECINFANGTSSVREQCIWWKSLLNVLCCNVKEFTSLSKSDADRPNVDGSVDIALSSEEHNQYPCIESGFIQTCSALDNMVCEPGLQFILSENISLLPPDLKCEQERVLKAFEQQEEKSYGRIPKYPSISELQESLLQLQQKLDEKKNILHILKEEVGDLEFNYIDGNMSATDKRLKLVLSDLHQLCTTFTCLYEELKPWLDRSQPALLTLGEKFETLQKETEKFCNVLQNLSETRSVFTQFKELYELSGKLSQPFVLPSYLEGCIEECTNILETAASVKD